MMAFAPAGTQLPGPHPSGGTPTVTCSDDGERLREQVEDLKFELDAALARIDELEAAQQDSRIDSLMVAYKAGQASMQGDSRPLAGLPAQYQMPRPRRESHLRALNAAILITAVFAGLICAAPRAATGAPLHHPRRGRTPVSARVYAPVRAPALPCPACPSLM
jgi:hypothetical protein